MWLDGLRSRARGSPGERRISSSQSLTGPLCPQEELHLEARGCTALAAECGSMGSGSGPVDHPGNAGSAAPSRLQFHYACKKSCTGRPEARNTSISSSQKGTSECPSLRSEERRVRKE